MTTSEAVDVRAHGAVGDGSAKDTRSLQAAIDACAAAGGGRVVVPPGTYLTGTIFLKANVELRLSAGATLRGSPDRADYNADDVFPENNVFAFERVSGAHLVIAYRAENVAITGQGTIDGSSACFLHPLPEDRLADRYRSHSGNFPIKDWRPGQMVFFCCCRDVAVRDVSLLNAPYWTLFLLGCDDVHVRGLTIVNPPQSGYSDGIDIDCCSRVTVSDCIIRTGDDSITLRGYARALGVRKPCENVTVTNCVLSSPCNAIRVGVGDGLIRNCSFSNIAITDSRTGINMVCRYSDRTPVGTAIESILFSGFVIDAVTPLQISEGVGTAAPAGIRNITFSQFRVSGEAGFYVGGNPELPIRGLRFQDWNLTFSGGTQNCELAKGVPYPYPVHGHPGTAGRPALPCAMYGTHLEDVELNGLRLRWGDDLSEVWRDGLVFEHVSGLVLRGLTVAPPRPGAGVAIRCRDVADVLVGSSQAGAGTHTFLRVEDAPHDARVKCIGNDLTAAEHPFAADTEVEQTGNLV